MLFALADWLLRRLVALAVGPSDWRTDQVEVLLLRHQRSILRRQVDRPRLRHRDRLFMSALSSVLPRDRWSSLVVRPQTLLGWHRELVRRKWALLVFPWVAEWGYVTARRSLSTVPAV